MSRSLTPDQRTQLIDAIKRVLELSFPEEFTRSSGSAGLACITDHLDALVEIVRRSTARQIEPYLWQVLEDVCDQCPHQHPSCHCPLRHQNVCMLYRSVPAIVETIAGQLVAMNDEEYLRTHPQCIFTGQTFWRQR